MRLQTLEQRIKTILEDITMARKFLDETNVTGMNSGRIIAAREQLRISIDLLQELLNRDDND